MGRLLGHIMAWHNYRDSAQMQLLEVGFDPGHAINMLTRQDADIGVTGIDQAPQMLGMAIRRNRTAVQNGQVRLGLGSAMQLPFADNSFDRAMSINCIYFWDDTVHGLWVLYHVSRPGGRLAITVCDKARPPYDRFNTSELDQMLQLAGFSEVTVQHNGIASHLLLCAKGSK